MSNLTTDRTITECPDLPRGWVREVVYRKSGASAGKSDIYYYSPDKKKCRSKVQMLEFLPEGFDLERFDFRAGRNVNSNFRRRKRRRDDFNFGKDFLMANAQAKPRRQTGGDIPMNKITKIAKVDFDRDENSPAPPPKRYSRSQQADIEAKKRRSEGLSQRVIPPRQLFWQRRLQGLRPVNEKSLQPCKTPKLDDVIKDLLPGSNNQALLNSVVHSLFTNSKVVGQQMSLNALRKNPGVWCNPDQPFCAPFGVTEDIMRAQERRVEAARKKLTEAQELLKALEEEEDDFVALPVEEGTHM